MIDFERALPVLVESELEFILVGGFAANVLGSARLTFDIDVVYARTEANFTRLVNALRPFNPYLRGAPPGLPFHWDENTLRMGLNFTLVTELGDMDLLGEVAGGGTYEELLPFTEEMTAGDFAFRCVTLPKLIELKRAAGRPKDFEVIAELEALLEERENLDSG